MTDSKLYEVKIDVFEGPMDLLLYLIRKDELDVYDIPIAHITKHYLAFLNQLHLLNIEYASDFILMAATLMRIKSQMMLPQEEVEQCQGEDGDLREELIRRLMEYQQFKELAEWLEEQKSNREDIFLCNQGIRKTDLEDGNDPKLSAVNLFDLLKAYKCAIETIPIEEIHEIFSEQISVEECVELIVKSLEAHERIRFADLIQGRNRNGVVSTFVGMLELLKSQRVRVQQSRPFDDIWIEKRLNRVSQLLKENSSEDIDDNINFYN
jgi:segregation and condensation protein A